MANITETSNFDTNVYQIETTDLVLGGPAGPANASAQNLTNRTRWLFDQNTANVAELSAQGFHLGTIDGEISGIITAIGGINSNLASINGQLPLLAPKANPGFTGVPTAPTRNPGDNSTSLATTAFIQAAIAALGPVGPPPTLVSNGNGLCLEYSNGYKIQSGTCFPNGGSVHVSFPVPFTSEVFPIAVSMASGPVQTWLVSSQPPTLAGMTVANTGGSSFWLAVGI